MKAPQTMGTKVMLALAIGLGCIASATAQSKPDHAWPKQPIHMIVPFSAGGSLDVVARTVAQHLGQSLGTTVIVENRAGANGIIGMESVAKAAPDGYTMLMSTGAFTANGVLYKKLPFAPLKDFTPVTQIARSYGLVLAVNNDVPAHSVKDFIEYIKAHPNSTDFGSSGEGNITHLAGALFNHLAGTDVQHVPYKGSAPAFQDVIARHITMTFVSTSGGLTAINDGLVRPLAISSDVRAPVLPNVPTFAQAGLPGMEAISGWYGLWFPAGTSPAIVARTQAAVASFLPEPAVKQRFDEMGLITMGTTPEAFSTFLAEDTEQQRRLMKLSNVQPQ